MKAFRLQTLPWNVVFGAGKLASLPGELDLLGFARALVLSTPEQELDAKRIAELLGDRSAGIFAEARMHVPVDIAAKAAQAARDCSADCSVSIG
ncbi:MAG: iron-containing alcohol dehydrogenase, partial [Gammaproteobacteria bacterium]|nr:iron-containing alcohol dehydrogenase [Gammaproteobacteria bacterium]